MNNIIDIVGFLDKRTIQGDNEDLEEESSKVIETYCIHTVQFKLLPNLIPIDEEMRKSILYIINLSKLLMRFTLLKNI